MARAIIRLSAFAAYFCLAYVKYAVDNALEALHAQGKRVGRPHILARGWSIKKNPANPHAVTFGRDVYSAPDPKELALSFFSK
jgi:hypothetical protein